MAIVEVPNESTKTVTIRLDGNKGHVVAGGGGKKPKNLGGKNGKLRLEDQSGVTRINLDAGGEGSEGHRVYIDGKNANLYIGGANASAHVLMQDTWGTNRIHLDAGGEGSEGAPVYIDGKNGDLYIGGADVSGRVLLQDGLGTNRIHLDAGGEGSEGAPVYIDGKNGGLYIGGADVTGAHLMLQDGVGRKVIELSVDPDGHANVLAGGNGLDGRIFLYPKSGDIPQGATATIALDGATGDIHLKNADCAEEFEAVGGEELQPGVVVSIDAEGALRQSRHAYDKRVVGVLSGAGGLRPGIVLGKDRDQPNRVQVALLGKVYCRVDASHGPIDIGDLLTTSPTSGHAMKASDPLRAFGAVIGKALRPLKTGQGLIPILIALQ
jgi:hypothetical protein